MQLSPCVCQVGIVLYQFMREEPMCLNVKCGEMVFVISIEEEHWYLVTKENGDRGIVPVNFIKLFSPSTFQSRRLRDLMYYHGFLSREDAEKLLNKTSNGSFLLRQTAHYPKDLDISLSFNRGVLHYIVRHVKGQYFTLDKNIFFTNIVQLVQYYATNSDVLPQRLTMPIIRHRFGRESKCINQNLAIVHSFISEGGYILQRDRLQIGDHLDRGEFGDVYKGSFEEKSVAVKSAQKPNSDINQFLSEACIMSVLHHPHILKLIAVVLDGDPLYIVTEYMKSGSLLTYLRTRGRMKITTKTLMKFSIQICDGMCYLEARNIIHRDLAARNVLLGTDLTAKIGDFGLAMIPKIPQKGKVPTKWTAPEGCKKHLFSSKSDVWSFGVLLWEIFSFGRIPYSVMTPEEVLQCIDEGDRLEQPDDCSDDIYYIMLDCWQYEPDIRPCFLRILANLKKILMR